MRTARASTGAIRNLPTCDPLGGYVSSGKTEGCPGWQVSWSGSRLGGGGAPQSASPFTHRWALPPQGVNCAPGTGLPTGYGMVVGGGG